MSMKRKPSAVVPEKSRYTRTLVMLLIIALIAGVLTVWRAGSDTVSAQELAPGSTTVTFGNSSAITINDNSTASPYPSTINVTGVNPAYMTSVRVSISGLTHSYPDDLDIILVGPQGQRSILMSDAGGGGDVTALAALGFEQSAATAIADETTLTAGIFRPANYDASGTDTFPAPGPGALFNAPADLGVFNGTDPNGMWSLYIVDDANQDAGLISGGWQLRFTVPAVFTVNSTADPGDGTCDATCTLRDAIIAANASATGSELIAFSGLFNVRQTIDLQSALPDISKSVTINGPGANLLTVRRDLNAATNFRVFTISGGITTGVAIRGMTVSGGNVAGDGGGISSNSLLQLNDLHVTGNTAANGGGVNLLFADGVFTNCTFSGNSSNGSNGGGGIKYQGALQTLRIINSTVSGNRSNSLGGGIYHSSGFDNSSVEIINSTISFNVAAGGGGVSNTEFSSGVPFVSLRNTIVSNNTPNNLAKGPVSPSATFLTSGFNLSDNYNGVFTPLASDITSATPRLGPLSLGGGTTPTHALLGSSPALNAGNASGSATDQRGVARPATLADIGAVEMQAIVVNNTGDSGPGTLREAISTANSNGFALDDIIFDNNVFGTQQTISLATALPNIGSNLTLNGPGADLLTVQRADGAADFKVFSSDALIGGEMAFTGMTIRNGRGFIGGGIFSYFALSLTNVHVTGNQSTGPIGGGGVYLALANGEFTNSTFSGNSALGGGAIYFDGDQSGGKTLLVVNSTISGNSATGSGGGILARTSVDNGLNPGVLIVRNSTIANNTAAGGGGIATETAAGNTTRTSLRNTIVANNGPNNLSAGSGVTVTSLGFNLSNNFNGVFSLLGTDITAPPLLATLANNGGTIPTHALFAGSQALDRGNSSGSARDQRGLTRPIDLPGITNISDGSDIGAFEAQSAPAAQNRAPYDYDGDNKTDISIFRPGPGEWWILRSSNGTNFATTFGTGSDKIVPADYTGDGKADVAFWRPSNGNWFILRSEDFTFFAFPFGTNGDVPVPTDFDGDNKADPALFRPSTLNWFIQKSTGGTDILTFGAPGDKPVVADYDGDAKADIAIYRTNGANQEWWIRRSSNGSVFATVFGSPTDKAVQGDYTGDGKADIAFWRPSNGNWFVLRSEDFSFFAFPFGANGDVPIPGDYDADGKIDAAVFRPSTLNWFIQRSTAGTLIQSFGVAGDIPTPNAYVP